MSDDPDTAETRATDARLGRTVKRAMIAIAFAAVGGLGTGVVAVYQVGDANGDEKARIRQIEREVDRMREEHSWLVRTLFRAPAHPAGDAP